MKEKLYGESYEIRCSNECYGIVNNGGTETIPEYCPFCGLKLQKENVKEIQIDNE